MHHKTYGGERRGGAESTPYLLRGEEDAARRGVKKKMLDGFAVETRLSGMTDNFRDGKCVQTKTGAENSHLLA